MQWSNVQEYSSSRLWPWPMSGLAFTLVAASVTLYLDAELNTAFLKWFTELNLITGDPDSARTILSVISGAMVTLLVFTFATTMVVIQLASAQFSPRLTRSVLRDRVTKVGLTLFISTFAYSLVVMRAVAQVDGQVYVPELSIAITYLMVLASLFMFVVYINHVAHSLRVGTVIERLTAETRGLIHNWFDCDRRAAARPDEQELDEAHIVEAVHGGAVSHVDEDGLVALARDRDWVIELLCRVGDHVPPGGALARVVGDDVDRDSICRRISMSRSRTMQQDVAYGIRQLADIANRALSPGINDPTTALQSIDGMHDLLRELVRRDEIPEALADEDGRCRLIVPRIQWHEYLALSVTEVRLAGASSPQIPRRLRAMLFDLHSAAPPSRRSAIDRQLELLSASVDNDVVLDADRALAGSADYQGLGGTATEH